MFQNPDDGQIRALLQRTTTIAVVGLSPKPSRPSYQVALHLQGLGYRIIPVRPAVDSVLGAPAYATLAQVPGTIDLVNVFRAPQYVAAAIDACIAAAIPAVWLQEGVIDEVAAERAQQAGLMVVMDRCISKDYVRLYGNIAVGQIPG